VNCDREDRAASLGESRFIFPASSLKMRSSRIFFAASRIVCSPSLFDRAEDHMPGDLGDQLVADGDDARVTRWISTHRMNFPASATIASTSARRTSATT